MSAPRVLVVDDEPDIRFFARVNLELSGYEVDEARDGEETVASVQSSPPAAIVLDVMMPGMDGFAVLEALKSSDDERVRTVPVVMLTALSGDQDLARGGIEGAVRYLVKPVNPDDLVAAVDEVLGGEPEPVQRRRAQQEGLERLARHEVGGDRSPLTGGPKLTRLERPPSVPPERVEEPPATPLAIDELTDRQRALLRALREVGSVTVVASDLGVSRSNIYSSLRRIARRLGINEVPELLRRLRSGELPEA